MLKNICYSIFLSVLALPCVVNAKYNPPKDVPQVSRAQKIAISEFNRLDKDGDGKLSPEEFGAKIRNYTRTEEKNIRRARKKGIYQSPEAQFAAADKDEDGFLSFNELTAYIEEYQKLDKGRARYY